MAPRRLAREEWLYFPDFHEPYITMEDYHALETMIGTIRKERKERLKIREEEREQMPDVFRGKVFCAECGRQMNFGRGSHHRGNTDLSFQYYRCRSGRQSAKCRNKKIQQNFLKIVVMDQIRSLIRDLTQSLIRNLIRNLSQSLIQDLMRNSIRALISS
jgi:hypothetical protein